MSSATSVNDALTGYLAGRVTAEQLVGTVTAAYYRERGMGNGERLKPVIDVISFQSLRERSFGKPHRKPRLLSAPGQLHDARMRPLDHIDHGFQPFHIPHSPFSIVRGRHRPHELLCRHSPGEIAGERFVNGRCG